ISGSSFTFSISASGTAPIYYQWYHDGVPMPGVDGLTYGKTIAGISDAGTYFVLVENVAGSVTSSPAVLTVKSPSRIERITLQPDDTCLLQFTGEAGSNYDLLASTNLLDWIPVT